MFGKSLSRKNFFISLSRFISCCTLSAAELSKRAVSILLFNLAIRNVNAQVIHGDTLTGEIQSVYRLRRGEKYSDIEETDIPERSVSRIN